MSDATERALRVAGRRARLVRRRGAYLFARAVARAAPEMPVDAAPNDSHVEAAPATPPHFAAGRSGKVQRLAQLVGRLHRLAHQSHQAHLFARLPEVNSG